MVDSLNDKFLADAKRIRDEVYPPSSELLDAVSVAAGQQRSVQGLQ